MQIFQIFYSKFSFGMRFLPLRLFSPILRPIRGGNFHLGRRQFCQQSADDKMASKMNEDGERQAKINRDLDPGVEVLEYIEVEEEGVEAPMVAEIEPYLRRDLVKRPISELTVDEFLVVLKDQQAKDISTYRRPQTQQEKESQEGEATAEAAVTIICSPHNARHAKTLEMVVRAFVKRNFHFQDERDVPKRQQNNSSKGGGGNDWFSLQIGHSIALHIMEENLRRRYNLESLVQGQDEELGFFDWCKANDYTVPAELLAKEKEEAKLNEGKRPRRQQRGTKNDEFIVPCI